MAPFKRNRRKQSMVTTFSSKASSAMHPLQFPNCTRLIRQVFFAIGTSRLRNILGLPGSFSNITSIAVCHRCGVKPKRKGNTIIVAWTRLMLSDDSAA
eukprot:3384635-Ditylum_brightwellii.AAC.1